MKTLKIMAHISLDGVMQSSAEDGFPYADWTAPYRTPAGRDAMPSAAPLLFVRARQERRARSRRAR